MRAARVWLALVVPLWIVLALCAAWEPVLGDSWGHFDYQRHDGSLWVFAKDNYLHMNPRLGQVITVLLFTPGPWHVIVTPLVELGLVVLLAALALGRWPSPRRLDDALVFATIVGVIGACTPVLGPMLYYRPYTGNYLYGLVLGLAFLVPYRFQLERPLAHLALVPAMLVLGAAAGMCNEHTGPTLAVLAIAACVHARRPAPWMIAGALGILAGDLALYFAPGQGLRYAGLAHHASLLGRIADRGITGNAIVLWRCLRYLVPVVGWIVLGLANRAAEPLPRPRKVAAIALAGGALAIALTLLGSPKQGDRLYFATIALVAAALACWLVPRLVAPWQRGLAWLVGCTMLAFIAWRSVTTYRLAGAEWDARLAALEHAAPGSTVQLVRYSLPKSRWFMGEDLDAPNKRVEVARDFGVASVELTTQRDATPDDSDTP